MDPAIAHVATPSGGEFQAHLAGESEIGRLIWRRAGKVMVAEHTLVPRSIGGRGVAAALVAALVAEASAKGMRIDPQCSYVAAAFARHPEWQSLRA